MASHFKQILIKSLRHTPYGIISRSNCPVSRSALIYQCQIKRTVLFQARCIANACNSKIPQATFTLEGPCCVAMHPYETRSVDAEEDTKLPTMKNEGCPPSPKQRDNPGALLNEVEGVVLLDVTEINSFSKDGDQT
jgi:hypothetical protein